MEPHLFSIVPSIPPHNPHPLPAGLGSAALWKAVDEGAQRHPERQRECDQCGDAWLAFGFLDPRHSTSPQSTGISEGLLREAGTLTLTTNIHCEDPSDATRLSYRGKPTVVDHTYSLTISAGHSGAGITDGGSSSSRR